MVLQERGVINNWTFLSVRSDGLHERARLAGRNNTYTYYCG